jgi:hypothetical protein
MMSTRLSPALVIGSVLVLAGACGGMLHPGGGSVSADRPFGPGGRLGPPGMVPGSAGQNPASLVDHICRAQPIPRGWIAITYTVAGESCPPRTTPGDPYNGAVIEYHRTRPAGTELAVCADQATPRGWIQVRGRETGHECHGARVRDGQPTVRVIRRVRD